MEQQQEIQKRDTPQENPKMFEEMFECPLCANLLYEPIVTSCGHTFCKSCILRGMDHDNKCPLCRAAIYITPEFGVCSLLQNAIQTMLPTQFQQRKLEIQKELEEQEFQLPLFLLGDLVLFPGISLPLHVFEPRYRLMIRRCLDGGRRFGVVPMIGDVLMSVGTTAVIENHWILPDGRSLVMTTGSRRFTVKSTREVDGYLVASVDYIQDEQLPTEKKAKESLEHKFQFVNKIVSEKLTSVLPAIEEKLGPMPKNMVDFSFWVGSVLPISSEAKYRILTRKTVNERFDEILGLLNTNVVNGFQCVIS